MNKEDIMIYAVGHKAMDTLKHRGYEIVSDDSEMINEPVYDDARILGEKLLKAFEDGEIGEIYLAYTDFKNTVVHEPKLVKLLPVLLGCMQVLSLKSSLLHYLSQNPLPAFWLHFHLLQM